MPTLDQIAETIDPIIDTFLADAIGPRRNDVRQRYEPNAERYCPNDAVRRLRDTLVGRLAGGKRTLGYLLGDYGHGKTAAAIHLWRECERNGICAVPPFQFTSFDDLVEAVAGWLVEAMKDRDSAFVAKAEELHARYQTRSVDQHAEEMARRHRLPLEVARTIVREEIAERISIGRAGHLADFLASAARLAVKGGYKALCVFADEMQIFVEAGEVRDNIEDFRQLILALRADDAPLGLLFILHERVGMVVSQNAGDAMQRMQDDGAAVNLGKHKEATFPTRLLDHLCKIADEKPGEVADEATLEALGQISQRDDLSNGPRTVAAAMRAIARHRAETGKIYRAWDLARDYERKAIVFDGIERSLSGALAQILSDEVVRSDSRYGELMKFLCVFPDGASRKFIVQYGYVKLLEELAQKKGLLGTVLYSPRSDHWALKALQANPGSEDRISDIIRLFRDEAWYQQTAAGRVAIARQAFARILLPDLFPRRGQGDAGRKFAGHLASSEAFDRQPGEILLTGSFEGTASRYPERRIAVAIGTEENRLVAYRPTDPDTHLAFVFRLDAFGEEAPHRVVSTTGVPRIDFTLNLDVGVGSDYPPELNLLADSFIPRFCSANVLLNLLFFLEDRVPKMTLPEADRQQIREYLTRSTRRVVEQILFPAEGVDAVGMEVHGRGRLQMESVFEQKMTELFPHYRPLHGGQEVRADLDRMARLLKEGNLPLLVRRGQRAIRLSSREFLSRIGATSASQYDALASRLKRLQLLATAREESMDGVRHADFTLTEHPLEVAIRREVESVGVATTVRRGGRDVETKRAPLDSLRRIAQRNGYLEGEFQTALNLASWRQWLEPDVEQVLIAVPADDPEALAREAEELERSVEALSSLDPDGARELADRLDLARRRMEGASPEDLSEISLDLRLLAEGVRERSRAQARWIRTEWDNLKRRAGDLLRNIPANDLARPIALTGSLGGVLENARKRLERQAVRLQAEIDRSAVSTSATSAADPAEDAGRDGPDTFSLEASLRERERQREATRSLDRGAKVNDEIRAAHRSLDAWRGLANRAVRLQDDVSEDFPALTQSLLEWIDSVVEAFHEAGTDYPMIIQVLGRHSDFQPALDALVSEQAREETRRREDYEAFQRRIHALYTESLIAAPRPTPFDPHDPERSYAILAETVASHLSEALRRLQLDLAGLAARAAFLQAFRERDVTAPEREIAEAREAVERALQTASPSEVQAYRRGEGEIPSLCGIHETASRARNGAAETLAALERADPPRGGLQEEVLLTLRRVEEGKASSVADLYRRIQRERKVTARELFEALEELYTQGNIEIRLIDRSPRKDRP